MVKNYIVKINYKKNYFRIVDMYILKENSHFENNGCDNLTITIPM